MKIPYPYTEKDAESWVRFRLEAAFAHPLETSFALRRPDGFLIGGAGVVVNGGAPHRAEIGYWVTRDYRNRGFATAAVRALSSYAFETLGLCRLEATAFPHNVASHRVLEKAGYRREGILAGYHLENGLLIDACMFALIAAAASSPA